MGCGLGLPVQAKLLAFDLDDFVRSLLLMMHTGHLLKLALGSGSQELQRGLDSAPSHWRHPQRPRRLRSSPSHTGGISGGGADSCPRAGGQAAPVSSWQGQAESGYQDPSPEKDALWALALDHM